MVGDYEKNIAQLWSDLFYKKITLGEALEKIRTIAGISVVSLNCAPSCNLDCRHCFYGFEKPYGELLTTQDWQEVIGEFIKLGVRHFHISGKEPLTSDMTFEILGCLLNYSREFDLKYGIITNGLLVDRLTQQLLQANLTYLDFSIDGEEGENDFLRGRGVFRKVITNMELAVTRKLAKRVYVSSVAYKDNRRSIVAMIERLSQNFRIRNYFIQPIQMHGRAAKLAALELSANEYTELLSFILDGLRKGSIKGGSRVVMLIPQYYLPRMLQKSEILFQALRQYFQKYSTDLEIGESKVAFRFHLTCLGFWRTVQITPDGYYLGCCMPLSSPRYWEYAVGNVWKQKVADLYGKSLEDTGPLRLSYDDSLVQCKEQPCFNQCFGGCRIFTHIRTGSWVSSHPSCQMQGTRKVCSHVSQKTVNK